MYMFAVRIADADRNVHESLTLCVAQHPSEAAESLVTRVSPLLGVCGKDKFWGPEFTGRSSPMK